MLQRIQTVFLFLVCVFTILFLLLPIGHLQLGGVIYEIKIWGISPDGYQAYKIPKGYLGYIGLFISLIIMFVSVYSSFQYKRRIYQIKIGKMNILLNMTLVVLTFFYITSLTRGVEPYFSYQMGVIFPLLSMVFILMANRAIRKDEEKVGASGRLR